MTVLHATEVWYRNPIILISFVRIRGCLARLSCKGKLCHTVCLHLLRVTRCEGEFSCSVMLFLFFVGGSVHTCLVGAWEWLRIMGMGRNTIRLVIKVVIFVNKAIKIGFWSFMTLITCYSLLLLIEILL